VTVARECLKRVNLARLAEDSGLSENALLALINPGEGSDRTNT
jgi:hypothetical protein